ncbi:MAG: TylF/MycF/NovP-related O-methyltransferase [Granulicella sp.]
MSLISRIALKCISKARHARLSTNTKTSHSIVIPQATYSPWIDDHEFSAAFERIRPNTLVDIYRAYELWSLVRETSHLDGDVLEVGVWRGGTGCLMAERVRLLKPAVTVFLCDTFKGVVKASDHDSHYQGGEHANTSMNIVRRLAISMGLNNIELLEGIFPDETGHQVESRRFSLCHIDVDVYESAKHVTDWVWPKLVVGGVIVYDDYGFSSCEGVTNLVNERVPDCGALTLHNLNGHAIVVKLR